jgi:D-alanyl-D-alanine carboxypeptidase/D-alanyl-D-alanine-endopeptidase (penicillin-binding protein 4)
MVRCLVAVAASLALAVPSALAEDLAAVVRRDIAALGLKKAAVAVSIRDVATGRVILSSHGNDPMIPASNMKVLTTGAALAALGPSFAFQTRLVRDGSRLVIIGDGDPALGDPELLAQSSFVDAAGKTHTGMSVEHLIDCWVRAAAASGITVVSEVVVDDRIFAREGAHPSWPKDQLDEAYCAPPSGVNFHGNALHVSVSPAASGSGAPTITRLSPEAPWLSIINKGTSRKGKSDRNTLWIARSAENGQLTLFGNAKATLESPIAVGLGEPGLFLGQCLSDRLRRRGISVGATRMARADEGAFTGDAIGPVLRTPLSTVITKCNVESENLYAEALIKRVGALETNGVGSWSSGARAVNAAIAARIGSAAGFRISDGSGLSRDNRVTADGMTAWLASVASDSTLGGQFLASLAVAGKSGTVARRMKDINPTQATVQCKTGYIDKVSCLSGIVTSGDGTRYAFSVLGNELSERDAVGKVKRLQDTIAKRIADAIGARSRSALGG